MFEPATRPRLAFIAVCALLGLSGCNKPPLPVALNFAVNYGGRPISCTGSAEAWLLTDLRFYVHDIVFTGRAGQRIPLDLADDGVWQGEGIALLDFEDGQGACLNGSPARNESVRGKLRGGPFNKVTLTVGVPEETNHRDPMIARAPLNYTPMHWHWLTGYKFLRVGVSNESDSFWMHLGSSHCDGSIGKGIRCNAPNRVRVEIDDFDVQKDRIVLDLERLLADVNLADGIASDCSSGPAEPACNGPFVALGLAPGVASAPTAAQAVFLREAAP